MSPMELVMAVQAAGATVRWSKDNPRLVGEVPDELMQEIKVQREAFLEAWEREYRDRYWRVPTRPIRLRSEPPDWSRKAYLRVERYVRHQNREVVLWTMHRAQEYAGNGFGEQAAMAAALADLLHWQMARHDDPVGILMDFDAATEFFNRHEHTRN